MELNFPAENFILQLLSREPSDAKSCTVIYEGRQGFRTKSVDGFNVVNEKKKDVEDIVEVTRDEGGQNGALDYTADNPSGFGYEVISLK